MNHNGQTAVYRVVVQSITVSDPRSMGLLHDAHTLGLHEIERVRCCDLYFLRGSMEPDHLRILTDHLLHDPVTQTAEITRLDPPPPDSLPKTNHDLQTRTIEVALRPGVTDSVAHEILRAAKLLAVSGLESASTGLRFILSGRELSDELLHRAAKRLFCNNVIQTYALAEIAPSFSDLTQGHGHVEVLPIRRMDDQGLLQLSSDRRAALNLEEMREIRTYCLNEDRDLTDVEFEMIAQTWSEHCVHKTFKSQVVVQKEAHDLRQLPANYEHLFNETIRAASKQINAPWVLSAFSENAGIVDFDGIHELSFKVETHNHPSAIEPFGGANTGIGGVIRDVIGVSAKPIASTDVLCFGPADLPLQLLPEGVLHPRRIASGVVAGIQDYGNKMGIPTVNGAICFDPGYTANPLVFCGSIGLAPKGSNPHATTPGDHIVVLGGRTGRDGLRGATFSSMTMDAQTGEVSGASVQIGAPVVEKGLVDVLMLARDQKLYHAITDCGAGGLSSAVGEMASELGGTVHLEHVPLKYPGLAPWEIWLSEAQERMVVAVPQDSMRALTELCTIYGVELTDIGEFSANGRMRVFYCEQCVLDLDNQFLHHGLPQRHYPAEIRMPIHPPGLINSQSRSIHADINKVLLKLLAHANIASKERVIRDYDHEVQGATVVKPLCGMLHDGPSDGSVIKPLQSTGEVAFVLSNGINPEYAKVDPCQMTWLVIDEAIRNAVACGADPARIAILDNFCWGNPTRPEIMGDLVLAAQACHDAAIQYGTPFISGKDSFNNEYLGPDGVLHAIPPTLLISALGILPDWNLAITADAKKEGNLIYLLGEFNPAFGGSHFNLIHETPLVDEGLPLCVPSNRHTFAALHQQILDRRVQSCHDISEGGLAVALSECCMAGRLGCAIELKNDPDALRTLFGETAGCFLVEIQEDEAVHFESAMQEIPIRFLGRLTPEQQITVLNEGEKILEIDLASLLSAWKGHSAGGTP